MSDWKREAARHRDEARSKQRQIEALANQIAVLQDEVEKHINAADAMDPPPQQAARVIPMTGRGA